MKLEITLSLILHLGLVAFTLITSPFDNSNKPQFENVIRVSLQGMPAPSAPEPVSLPEPVIPQAIDEPMPDIPIDDPTTRPEAVLPEKTKPVEKPNEKPKPDKPKQPATQPSGEQTGTSKTGTEIDGPGSGDSPFGGATIDNASFNYPYWFTLAFNKIRGNWRNPVNADIPITCTIYFQVIKSGRLVKAEIKESSGIAAFDNACLSAVENSAPFPPLPKQFIDEIIGITLPMQYRP